MFALASSVKHSQQILEVLIDVYKPTRMNSLHYIERISNDPKIHFSDFHN
jgi:hypothetical protein